MQSLCLSSLIAVYLLTSCVFGYSGGKGTPLEPYEIAVPQDLVDLGKDPANYDKWFVQTADIDMNKTDITKISPIGNFEVPFEGVYDGGNHIILDFRCFSSNVTCSGLFGHLAGQNTEVKNLGLVNPTVDAGTGFCVGSLVGCLANGRVSSCFVENGSVKGGQYVGGLIGCSLPLYPASPAEFSDEWLNDINGGMTRLLIGQGDLDVTVHGFGLCSPVDCDWGMVTGEYTGSQIIAVYGSVLSTRILTIDLVNLESLHIQTRTVFHDGSNRDYERDTFMHRSSGSSPLTWDELAGRKYSDAYVVSCRSTGSVSGRDQVGGLMGNNYSAVSESSSTCDVKGHTDVGGLVGYNYGQIDRCTASGGTQGQQYVGGLVGNNASGDIINSYATGDVRGDDRVGGLAGALDFGTINKSYAIGNVTSNSTFGGLVGHQWWGNTSASFWDIQTSGVIDSDGGEGLTTGEMKDIKTYLDGGWSFSDDTIIDHSDIWLMPAGGLPRLVWESGLPKSSSLVEAGFESGDFTELAWDHKDEPWRVNDSRVHTGIYSAQSGHIGPSEASVLLLSYECGSGHVGFSLSVSSEKGYDKLVFQVDGQEVASWSGVQDWINVVFPISAGTHLFSWSYEKDGSVSRGEDAAWIDALSFPLSDHSVSNDAIDIVFVDIPGATFEMGDHFGLGWSDEIPLHEVTIDGFKMAKYETTNVQYTKFLNAALNDGLIQVVDGVVYSMTDISYMQPYCSTRNSSNWSQIQYNHDTFAVNDREDHPVVCVSWHGAKAFCDYYGYRLPTEAEWEYAARGGYHDPYYMYPWGSNGIDCTIVNMADCIPLSLSYPSTTAVGWYGAQGAYGLCDMSGNVWEWCQDWYGSDYYSQGYSANPIGPATGIHRVLRGGSWSAGGYYCRVACRDENLPSYRHNNGGFRACVSNIE